MTNKLDDEHLTDAVQGILALVRILCGSSTSMDEYVAVILTDRNHCLLSESAYHTA